MCVAAAAWKTWASRYSQADFKANVVSETADFNSDANAYFGTVSGKANLL